MAKIGTKFAFNPSDDNPEGTPVRSSLTPECAEICSPDSEDKESGDTKEKNEKDEGRVKTNKVRRPVAVDHQKELLKIIRGLSSRHHHWKVFSDFCEMSAITISNGVDQFQKEKREERCHEIRKAYTSEEMNRFCIANAHLIMAHEDAFQFGEFTDVLGRTYHELELHSKWAGQYFTPCQLTPSKPSAVDGACGSKFRTYARKTPSGNGPLRAG